MGIKNVCKILNVFTRLALVTFLLSACAQDSLEQLNQSTSISAPQSATIIVKNYCPKTNQTYHDFYAIHHSMVIRRDGILLDDDNDGIPTIEDNSEVLMNVPWRADSNFDGYRDLTIWLGGFDWDTQQGFRRCDAPDQDTDLDGLTDCEEKALTGTDPNDYDSDNDGIPDFVELKFSMNPLDKTDVNQVLGTDGLIKMDRVKYNLPTKETITADLWALRVQYSLETLPEVGVGCFNMEVSHLPILNVKGGNLIKLYFLERETGVGGNTVKLRLKTCPLVIQRGLEDKTIIEVEYDQLDCL